MWVTSLLEQKSRINKFLTDFVFSITHNDSKTITFKTTNNPNDMTFVIITFKLTPVVDHFQFVIEVLGIVISVQV